MKRVLFRAGAGLIALAAVAGGIRVASVAREIQVQSTLEEAQPSDIIIVMGAAEYRGRPSPVLEARLNHALYLYHQHLAPRILTTGGAGGDRWHRYRVHHQGHHRRYPHWGVRSQGAFAAAGHCVRSRRRTAPGIHRRPDAGRLLFPDHAAWRHGGPHRGLRDTAVRAWAKTPTDIEQRLKGRAQPEIFRFVIRKESSSLAGGKT